MPYTILFLSSAEISVPLLEALIADQRFDVTGLICQADKPAGRELKRKKPASKLIAEKNGIEVFQPISLKLAVDLLERFRENPPDFLISFAYGQILSGDWLDIAKIAPLNVHASLLPRYRGASPIQAAILNGDKETGISLMKMVKEMDAGPVASMKRCEIEPHMTAGFLHDALAELAATFVPDELLRIASSGDEVFSEQDHSKASFTKKISRKDGFLDFKKSAKEIDRIFHAYTPWPGVWTTYNGKRLKFIDLDLCNEALAPGTVKCGDRKVMIGTSDGSLLVKQLQLEGKQCLHADQFVIGQPEFCSSSLPS